MKSTITDQRTLRRSSRRAVAKVTSYKEVEEHEDEDQIDAEKNTADDTTMKKQKRMDGDGYDDYSSTEKKRVKTEDNDLKIPNNICSSTIHPIQVGSSDGGRQDLFVKKEDDNESDIKDLKKAATKGRKKPAAKKKKKKEDSPEEIEASKEIDRLLQQASEDFNEECGAVDAQLFNINKDKLSLANAKKKLGSVKLLELLQKKLCYKCRDEKRLGMFFFRQAGSFRSYSADHIEASICCHCFSQDNSTHKQICETGEWTWGQAEKGLKISSLSNRIDRNWYQYKYNNDGKSWMKPVKVEKGRFGETKLFSAYTVTLTALTISSIWNLHYELAMKEKRRRKIAFTKRSYQCIESWHTYNLLSIHFLNDSGTH